MKKPILILTIIIILVIAAVFIFLNKKTSNPVVNTAQPNQTNTEATNPAANQNVENNVSIKNFSFLPPILNISAGQKVVWTNHDSVPHQIKADVGSFKSAVLNKGDTYEYVFVTPGNYSYHCSIHPSMKGQVIVK